MRQGPQFRDMRIGGTPLYKLWMTHYPFDVSCPIFVKYKIINAIMAYCNVNQFKPIQSKKTTQGKKH